MLPGWQHAAVQVAGMNPGDHYTSGRLAQCVEPGWRRQRLPSN